MQLVINGFPKSGNHALAKAIQLLGVPCDVNHLTELPEHTHCIFIKRDPRNILISWLRFKGQSVTPGMFLTYFRKFEELSLVAEMAKYEKFLADKDALVVKYEELVKDDKVMKQIAKYLGVPYIQGAFNDLPGLTRTWNSEHSDYNKIWTPLVEDAWNKEGGRELLARWGYK